MTDLHTNAPARAGAPELIPSPLVALIARELTVHVDDVKPQALLCADLKADSLDVVCLVVAIEDEFAIRLSDNIVAQLKDASILDIVTIVEAAQAERQPKEEVRG